MIDSYASHPTPYWPEGDRLRSLIPAHLTPFPYQLAALERFAALGGKMLLPHPPGAGKTATALMAAHLYGGKVVIICPPAVAEQWRSQAERWGHPRVSVVSNLASARTFRPTFGCIRILPDSLVRATTAGTCDLLVVDESHRFKAQKAVRTKRTLGRGGWAGKATRVLLMSGTPALNGSADLFTTLFALDHPCARTWAEFSEKFCPAYKKYLGARQITCYDKSQNLPELNRILRSEIIHLPPLAEIQAQLPPLRRDRMRLSVNTGQYSTEDAIQMFDGLRTNAEQEGQESTAFAGARRILGERKAEAATDLLQTLIEGGDRPIIWVWHRAVAQMLSSRLGIPAIYGGVPDVLRKAAIADFVAGKVPGLIASISTLGTGVDGLQYATDFAVFLERSYVPADNEQAEARIRRTGQHKPCRFLILTSHDPLDAALEHILNRKTADIQEIHA